MKNFSRRKFVETTVIGGVGAGIFPGLADSRKNINKPRPEKGTDPAGLKTPEKRPGQACEAGKDILPPRFDTMRPIRDKHNITVTVGQDCGEFRGDDDKILQAAVDYVAGLGGGTVCIMPGVYTMRNSLFPRSGLTIKGSGETTILRKCASVSSKLIREADWYEDCVQVERPEGFTVGGGLALSRDDKDPREVRFFTITGISNNVLFLDKRTEHNYWMMESARASTRFSIIYGFNVDNVAISDLVLDGNRNENEHVDDNYAAALFMQYCNGWNFKNVIARNYNSDGFSFQVCDDIHFEDCSAINNADLGYHPGSGSQRPVFIRCTARGNSQGFFWCWGVCDGIAENCLAEGNMRYGINFGHRDTDNIIRNCIVENNGETGIIFREEPNEYRTGDRNLIDGCIIRNNGNTGPGLGIDVQYKNSDITIRNCKFENCKGGLQHTGIRIGQDAERIKLESNTFSGIKVQVEDLRTRAKI